MAQGLIRFRRAESKDIPCVTSNWLKSFRDGALVSGVPNNLYYHTHERLIQALIRKPNTVTLLAVNADDEDQILGWVCAELREGPALLVHYTYVKAPFRRRGIARMLVEKVLEAETPAAIFYTHKTYKVKKLRDKGKAPGEKNPIGGWVYNPYVLFTQLPEGWYR